MKDIKEVQKQKKIAQDAKQLSEFKWDTMGSIDQEKQQQQQRKEEAKDPEKKGGDIKFKGKF